MRSRLFRILLTLSNLSRPAAFQARPRAPNATTTTLKSMPSIPFISALFGTSAPQSSKNTMTSYPDQRTPDEWRAVLSPSKITPLLIKCIKLTPKNSSIPHPPRKGHRTPRQRHLRQARAQRRGVHVRGVRRAAVHGAAQVLVRVRLAGLLRQHPRRGDAARGPRPRHGAHRDRVRQLRGASGPCVQGGGL